MSCLTYTSTPTYVPDATRGLITIRYFHSPSGNLLGLYAASVYLPSLLFAFVGEQISNRYGRRTAIWVGTVILFAGGIFNAFSQNPGQFIGSRVIIGSGGSIAKVGAPALLVEIAHPRLRPILGGVYFGLYYSGSLISAIVCSEWLGVSYASAEQPATQLEGFTSRGPGAGGCRAFSSASAPSL